MTIELMEEHDGKVLTIHANDKLTSEIYDHFLPEAQRLIERFGKISVLFDMRKFPLCEIRSLWEDIKYGMIHFHGFERLAIIGDKQREGCLSMFCRLMRCVYYSPLSGSAPRSHHAYCRSHGRGSESPHQCQPLCK